MQFALTNRTSLCYIGDENGCGKAVPMYKTPKNVRTVSKKNSIKDHKAARAKGRSPACRNDFFTEIQRFAYCLEQNHPAAFPHAPGGGYAQPYCAWRAAPGRDEVLRLCFALELEAVQAQRLLGKSGNRRLDPKLLRDAAILFSLGKHLDLEQVQALLRKLNVTPL